MATRQNSASPLASLFAKTALPAAYRHFARKPVVGNRVLFVEQSSPVLTAGMQELCCYLDNDCGYEVRFASLGEGRTGLKRQLEDQLRLAQRAATSSYIFYEGDVPALAALPLRPETQLVNLNQYAGCPAEDICLAIMAGLSHVVIPSEQGPHAVISSERSPHAVIPSERSESRDLGLCPSTGKPSQVERFAEIPRLRLGMTGGTNTPDLSIIVPAHNSEPFLARAVDSVLAQTYPLDRIELILVDDGSTDGTQQIIQDYAAEYPGLVCAITLPQASGSPAAPRNRGLDAAQGEYVFFLDSDDWLAPKAVELMMRHAREWVSDVLLVRMVSEDGRGVPRKAFKGNIPKVDVATSGALATLGPLKLYRRSLLEGGAGAQANGNGTPIRFPEGTMPEDVPFALRAYLAANIVSVASDYAYYHVSMHEEGQHAVSSVWANTDSNLVTFADVLDTACAGLSREQREAELLPRLFRRDVYQMLRNLANLSQDECSAKLALIRDLFGPHYTQAVRKSLPCESRIACDAAFLASEQLALGILDATYSHSLAETCEWSGENGKLTYKIAVEDESIEGDVTDAASASFELQAVSDNLGGITFTGSLSAWTGLAALPGGVAVELVAKSSGNKQAVWSAATSWSDRVNGEGFRELAGTWHATLNYDDVAKLCSNGKIPMQVQLFMRASWHGWSCERRLAQKASAAARNGFSACRGKAQPTDGVQLTITPATSNYCKFDLQIGGPN